jgi:hypothetical protein
LPIDDRLLADLAPMLPADAVREWKRMRSRRALRTSSSHSDERFYHA